MERLRVQAMQAGINILEFWAMTPREIYWMIDAAIWHAEQEQRRNLIMAWQTAALTRAKRMPSIRYLLSAKPARKLQGKVLEQRRQEFHKAGHNFDAAAAFLKHRKANNATGKP